MIQPIFLTMSGPACPPKIKIECGLLSTYGSWLSSAFIITSISAPVP